MNEKSIWSYQDNFDFRKDVAPGDPLYVPLERHRGEYNRMRMLSTFNLDPEGGLRPGTLPKRAEAVLFGGHVGCGKSTELRSFAQLFRRVYTVRHLEMTKLLDVNNLRFSDMLIALTQSLVAAFQEDDLSLQPARIFIDPIVNWFDTRIVKREVFRDIEAELKTQATLRGGIPYLASLLATVSGKIRGGATYRDELRREVRDGFLQLLIHFNALIDHANALLIQQGKGPLLFIIDGTDRMPKEDSDTFFHADVNQLGQILVNMVVCAPISVLIEGAAVAQRFTRVQLPMVKVVEADGNVRQQDEQAVIELVLKRMPLHYFDGVETVRYLVQHSGGHVRDLLRLIRAAFSRINGEQITRAVAEHAVRDVASEYQRYVRQSDWQDLVLIDQSEGVEKDRTDDRLRMLYDMVLLEYNSFWWRSHPLVRTLAGYDKAKRAMSSAESTGA